MSFFCESIFSFVIIIFVIMLVCVLIKHFNPIINIHLKYTSRIISIFMLISLLIVLLTFEDIKISKSLLTLGIVFKILLTSLFTITGLFFCERIEQQDIPILKSLFEKAKLNIDFSKFGKYLVMFLTVNIIFTIIINGFIHLNKTIPDSFGAIYDFNNILSYNTVKYCALYLLGHIQNAIDEEIIFRLCLMNFIMYFLNINKNKYWIGIIISSTVFAMGHYQTIDSPIAKSIQVLPVGIGLGVIYQNFGLECSIVSHLIFNFVASSLYFYSVVSL